MQPQSTVLSAHELPTIQISLPKTAPFTLTLVVLQISIPLQTRLRFLPQLIVVRLGKLLRLEPFPACAPDLDEPEVARVLRVVKDVEEQALGLATAGFPDWSVRGFPFLDAGGLDVKVDEEGCLGSHCGCWNGIPGRVGV